MNHGMAFHEHGSESEVFEDGHLSTYLLSEKQLHIAENPEDR